MNKYFTIAGMLTLSVVMMGCATQNYDFAIASNNGSPRISQLVDDLNNVTSTEESDDDALYEISVFPLVHSHLHVFSEDEEKESPAEFVEADINSYLPLFSFVNGTVSKYDENQELLTRTEFESNLWGAFGKHRKFVATHAGVRETIRHTILWIFSWDGKEQWHPTKESRDEQGAVAAQRSLPTTENDQVVKRE